MKKYKITIDDKHIYVDSVAAAMVAIGERLDIGKTKIMVEIVDHPEKAVSKDD